jgi:hypothetical protein
MWDALRAEAGEPVDQARAVLVRAVRGLLRR